MYFTFYVRTYIRTHVKEDLRVHVLVDNYYLISVAFSQYINVDLFNLMKGNFKAKTKKDFFPCDTTTFRKSVSHLVA